MGLKMGLTLLSLLLFGIVYNWIVARMERTGYEKCYVSLLVVIGVAVTGCGYGFVAGWEHIVPLVACFVASGVPMIAGSVARYVQSRAKLDETFREEIQHLFGRAGG